MLPLVTVLNVRSVVLLKVGVEFQFPEVGVQAPLTAPVQAQVAALSADEEMSATTARNAVVNR